MQYLSVPPTGTARRKLFDGGHFLYPPVNVQDPSTSFSSTSPSYDQATTPSYDQTTMFHQKS